MLIKESLKNIELIVILPLSSSKMENKLGSEVQEALSSCNFG
jgi:hypothetical protein